MDVGRSIGLLPKINDLYVTSYDGSNSSTRVPSLAAIVLTACGNALANPPDTEIVALAGEMSTA